jgi:hypothetical protein
MATFKFAQKIVDVYNTMSPEDKKAYLEQNKPIKTVPTSSKSAAFKPRASTPARSGRANSVDEDEDST